MKIRSSIKAGPAGGVIGAFNRSSNHSETKVRGLKVKSAVKAGPRETLWIASAVAPSSTNG